ncbi:MAG: DUF1877 family protein [Chitinophagaceae bacterium]|nr:MAG: DUF1877 family protein [Chitinophagaceae bacterium]
MSMIGYFLKVSTEDLRTYVRNSTLLQERLDAWYQGDPDMADVDKSWEGLLYILTGSGIADDPKGGLAKIFNSERVIDEDQDLGYGPANYVNPEEVAQLSKELSAIDREDLADRFDPDAMNEAGIYPEGWDDGDMLEYLLEHFDTLKDFYALAAKESAAVIFYVG